MNKKKKDAKVRMSDIQNFCWIFVKSQIENPEFDSQTKENLTLIQSEFGSNPILSPKYLKMVEQTGITDAIENVLMAKENRMARKLSGKKTKMVQIQKLDDAIKAWVRYHQSALFKLTNHSTRNTNLYSDWSIQTMRTTNFELLSRRARRKRRNVL